MKVVPITVPANTIEGVSEPLEILAESTVWMVADEFPEELAYETTKLIIQHIKTFSDYHALGKLMSTAALSYGWDQEEFHPDALRAYKEAGLLK